MNPTVLRIRETQQIEHDVAQERHQLVAQLRMEGWSWTRIADVLNISKQAAAKTYGPSADAAFRRAMKDARQLPGQTTVDEQLSGLALVAAHALPEDAEGSWIRAAVEAQLEAAEAAAELPELPGTCLSSHGCENPIAARGEYMCDWHIAQLDEAVERGDLDIPRTGAGAVHCPECRVEPGESCRVRPTYEPTRRNRPHAARVRLATSSS